MGTNSKIKEAHQQQLRDSWKFQDQMAAASRGRGGGGGSCFPASALVLTPGGEREMADIQPGSLVVSTAESGAVATRRVLKKKVHRRGRLWRVECAGESAAIDVTKRHSFLTDRGWVQAWRLRPGDRLRGIDASYRHVVTIGVTNEIVPVFNLITESEHTFVVHGCIVHNYTYWRSLRTWCSELALHFRSRRPRRIETVVPCTR
jgi:hypothetical protein